MTKPNRSSIARAWRIPRSITASRSIPAGIRTSNGGQSHVCQGNSAHEGRQRRKLVHQAMRMPVRPRCVVRASR
jgi:hypothetical protein